MPDLSSAESRDRRRSLYAFLEPVWLGRRVLEIGPSIDGTAELLKSLGAAKVVVSDGDLASLTERFDVVVVPEGEALVRRPGAVAACRKLVAAGGRLVVAAGNAERPGATGGVGYYDLHGAVAPLLPLIQMLGMTPFSGIGVVEFDGAVDALRIDSRLVKDPEAPVAYVAIAGTEPVAGLGYALVQLPSVHPSSVHLPSGEGQAALTGEVGAPPAARVTPFQAEEIEEMRARIRRAAEDRAALDTENAKLRRALAEANESIMNLTRRTTEEMAAVAERLTTGLRAPLEAEARASAAALAEAREEADRLRVKLAESEARAAAAEQRLEELGGLARERQAAVEDALERQRLAESELARARREMARLENGARTAVVDDSALEERSRAVAQRDERILRLEGEKQDLTWRLAELEDKLRQAIARAVQGSAGRAEAAQGYVPAGALAAAATSGRENDDLAAARGRALEEFHRASTAHVDELTELKASVSEQTALVAELEDTLAAAEARAATSSAEATTLRKTAKDLEEADRTRRARLAELEGKLLRLEHERKAAVGRDGAEVDRLHALEAERDRLRVRVGELEALAVAGAGKNGKNNGHDAGAAAIARDLDAVEANLRAEVGRAGASTADASRLENTLDNYRRRASRLRDDLEGIRRRLESLSPSEISGFLEELGEDLAELGG
jgi:hypothetical protein